MRWTGSLIRIAEHEIEDLRRRVAEIVERRMGWETALVRLAEEAVAEAVSARENAEAGWYLVGFRQGWQLRKDKALAELAAVKMEEQGARDALLLAYEDLKKVELVAEGHKQAANKEVARLEGLALDELALRRSQEG